jgi:hypothetical protein
MNRSGKGIARRAAWAIGLLAVAAVAGCSWFDKSDPAPAATPVPVTVTTDAKLVAVDDGGGWRKIEPSTEDNTVYTIDAAGRYGVALVANDNQVRLYQLTTAEVTRIRRIFSPAPATYRYVSGTVRNLVSPYYSSLITNSTYSSTGGSPRTFTNYPMKPGLFDFIGIEIAPDYSTPNRVLFIQRNMSGDNTVTGVDVDFDNAVSFAALPASTVGGTLTGGLYTKNGQKLGLKTVGLNTTGNLIYPSAGLLAGDRFFLQGALYNGGHTQWHRNLDALALPDNVLMDFTGIAKYDPPFVQATRTFDNLVYAVPARCPPFIGDLLVAAHHDGPAWTTWYAWVSKGWLGGATAYALPDLSGVTGWSATWAIPEAGGTFDKTTLRWMSNQPLEYYLENDIDFYEVNRGVPVPGLDLLISGEDNIDI